MKTFKCLKPVDIYLHSSFSLYPGDIFNCISDGNELIINHLRFKSKGISPNAPEKFYDLEINSSLIRRGDRHEKWSNIKDFMVMFPDYVDDITVEHSRNVKLEELVG